MCVCVCMNYNYCLYLHVFIQVSWWNEMLTHEHDTVNMWCE
jgi:hypothetical protein